MRSLTVIIALIAHQIAFAQCRVTLKTEMLNFEDEYSVSIKCSDKISDANVFISGALALYILDTTTTYMFSYSEKPEIVKYLYLTTGNICNSLIVCTIDMQRPESKVCVWRDDDYVSYSYISD